MLLSASCGRFERERQRHAIVFALSTQIAARGGANAATAPSQLATAAAHCDARSIRPVWISSLTTSLPTCAESCCTASLSSGGAVGPRPSSTSTAPRPRRNKPLPPRIASAMSAFRRRRATSGARRSCSAPVGRADAQRASLRRTSPSAEASSDVVSELGSASGPAGAALGTLAAQGPRSRSRPMFVVRLTQPVPPQRSSCSRTRWCPSTSCSSTTTTLSPGWRSPTCLALSGAPSRTTAASTTTASHGSGMARSSCSASGHGVGSACNSVPVVAAAATGGAAAAATGGAAAAGAPKCLIAESILRTCGWDGGVFARTCGGLARPTAASRRVAPARRENCPPMTWCGGPSLPSGLPLAAPSSRSLVRTGMRGGPPKCASVAMARGELRNTGSSGGAFNPNRVPSVPIGRIVAYNSF